MSDRLKGKRAFVTAGAAGSAALARSPLRAKGHGFCDRHRRKGTRAARQGRRLGSGAARRARQRRGRRDGQARRQGRHPAQCGGLRASRHGAGMFRRGLGFLVRPQRQVDAPDHPGFLPGMLEAGRGSIVNISSAAGVFKAAPNRYVYGATKAAVAALTRAVAADFITRGIRCNCICPGTIETPSMLDRAAAAGPKGREMFVAGSRWAGSAPPMKSPRSRSILPATRARSPPASPTSSTAAGRFDSNSPRIRGRGRRGAPGEGQGTALNSSTAFAGQQRASHPTSRKCGASEQNFAAATAECHIEAKGSTP